MILMILVITDVIVCQKCAKNLIRTVWKPESTVILPAVLLVTQHVPGQQIAIGDHDDYDDCDDHDDHNEFDVFQQEQNPNKTPSHLSKYSTVGEVRSMALSLKHIY